MTKEEATKELKIELSMWESDCKSYHKTKEALKMAIKALEQESFENAYKQVVKERDIAIEQLNELGYSWGEKIEPCNKVRAEIEAQEKWLAKAGYNAYNVSIAFESVKRALEK